VSYHCPAPTEDKTDDVKEELERVFLMNSLNTI
jgi:hypothetical protein